MTYFKTQALGAFQINSVSLMKT